MIAFGSLEAGWAAPAGVGVAGGAAAAPVLDATGAAGGAGVAAAAAGAGVDGTAFGAAEAAGAAFGYPIVRSSS